MNSKDKADQDYDAKLQRLVNRYSEQNIRLNSHKLQLRRTEVPYAGHLLISPGPWLDPEQFKTI